MRTKYNFDKDWFFSLCDDERAKAPLFDHSGWDTVKLPHDFSVGHDFEKHAPSGTRGGFTKSGVGLYRKFFEVTAQMLEKRVFLEFDGVFMNALVCINGVEVCTRPYGYSSFGVDITAQLHEGLNLVFVRADCEKQTQGRWYSGCGIYRHVHLTITEKVYVAQWGSFVRTEEISAQSAQIKYDLELANETLQSQDITLESTCYDAQNRPVSTQTQSLTLATGLHQVAMPFQVENPSLWYPETPNLYRIVTKICVNNNEVDCYESTFGIRETEFIPNQGFFLNGKHYNFKGVCLHHDCGVVGAAVPDTIWKKRIGLLKEMGCNAIRTSHNPFSPEFYDICDEMGMFVMDEIFDGWETAKAPYDYGLYFEEWHERDCIDFIKRDRNHPSVVIWSIGNEVTNMNPEITTELQNLFHRYDDTRKVTCGVQGKWENSDENRALLDVAGYNDGGGACFAYERDHERRPDQLMIATEAPHTMHTRGYYRTQTWWRDKNQPRIEIENLTEEELFDDGYITFSSSYDNHGVRVCARDSYSIVERLPYLCGEFRWTGIDYMGETFGWPNVKSDNGVIDTAHFKKDHFYLYQSMWRDPKELPMVHVLPHWTHEKFTSDTIVPVWVYTNCQEVELFLNGTSLGRKARGAQKHLQFDVAYIPGELKAVAYLDGIACCEDVKQTAGVAAQLQLTCTDKGMFNGADTVQLDCAIHDENNVFVPYADNTVHFLVEGAARLVGTDSGCPIDHVRQTSPVRQAFYGLCAATLELSEQPGDVCVHAASILGRKVFNETTQIHIVAQSYQIAGQSQPVQYEIYYSLNSNQATKTKYTAPFTISQTTAVYADVYQDGIKLFTLYDYFVKGVKEPVIDLAHRNRALDLKYPVGPFSEKLIGRWSDGSFELLFNRDGTIERQLTADSLQPLGYWWYDFPVDFFEAQEYAGTGEIWLSTGEKVTMRLLTQEGKALEIDNHAAAFGTAFGFNPVLNLQKL